MNPNKGEQVQSVDLWRMGEGMIAASWHLVYRASHCGQYTSVVSGWACCPVTNYFSRVSSVVCSIPMAQFTELFNHGLCLLTDLEGIGKLCAFSEYIILVC